MQIPHPSNFSLTNTPSCQWATYSPNWIQLCIGEQVQEFDGLQFPTQTVVSNKAILTTEGEFSLSDDQGRVWLCGEDGYFGQSLDSWVFRIQASPDMRFYGLGEKGGSLDRRGIRTRMWNVDVWGEHPLIAVQTEVVDPLYVSIPWMVIEREIEGVRKAIGVYIRNPRETFFSLCPDMRLHPSQDPVNGGSLYWGAMSGNCEMWFLLGDSVELVCQQFALLIGTMKCPEPWALGNHQCRWGYRGIQDLQDLDLGFIKSEIPCDGLWLDIDYMDGYRVFSLSPSYMKDAQKGLADLRNKGRRVVAILDPGVKEDEKEEIYQEGISQQLFCKNPTGSEYRGIVWPGVTVYPDFSLASTRTWWTTHVKKLAELGFAGFWIDMNDPSTGSVPCKDMLFQHGQYAHDRFHNVYANAMAEATYLGLQAAHPEQTPFVLTRSASTGIARFAGVWMGDNYSNWFHLQQSIPMGLNLSMSGVPFVGADIPGFGGAANDELMERWVAAHCLFPFFRNHSAKDAPKQEPWQFPIETQKIIKKWIDFRYCMIPYLLQLFREQEVSGSLILRPIFFEDSTAEAHSIEDQFMVGRHVMVAPILESGLVLRRVYMPVGEWRSGWNGTIYAGGRYYENVPCPRGELLWFTRVGAHIPHLEQAPKVSTEEVLEEMLRISKR